jgi:hypothetical protein
MSGTSNLVQASSNLPIFLRNTNYLINGDFNIWQRGTSFSSPADGTYCADRWRIGYNGSTGTFTVSQVAFAASGDGLPTNPRYYLNWNQTVSGGSEAFRRIEQRVEDVRPSSNKTFTLSAWVYSAAATTVKLSFEQYFGPGGSAAVQDIGLTSFAIPAGSWIRISMTAAMPSISGKTLVGGGYFSAQIGMPTNTTFQIRVAQVQLEEGSIATPYSGLPPQEEFLACCRYFERNSSFTRCQLSNNGGHFSGAVIFGTWNAYKRANPSIVVAANDPSQTRSRVYVNNTTLSSSYLQSVTLNGFAIWNNGAMGAIGDYFALAYVEGDCEL